MSCVWQLNKTKVKKFLLIQKLFNNKFYDTLNTFSKVTNYVLGVGHFDLQERRPQSQDDQVANDKDEFEFLNSEEVSDQQLFVENLQKICEWFIYQTFLSQFLYFDPFRNN